MLFIIDYYTDKSNAHPYPSFQLSLLTVTLPIDIFGPYYPIFSLDYVETLAKTFN